jgi:hypothetical protein
MAKGKKDLSAFVGKLLRVPEILTIPIPEILATPP